jgi:hypothetical protein
MLVTLAGFMSAACSAEDNRPASIDDGNLAGVDPQTADGSPVEQDGGSAACTSFDTRHCTIDLGTVNGIHNCQKGVQICENGVWTPCAVRQP